MLPNKNEILRALEFSLTQVFFNARQLLPHDTKIAVGHLQTQLLVDLRNLKDPEQ